MKQIRFLITVALLLFIGLTPVYASEMESGAAASLSGALGNGVDTRKIQLSHYLRAVNSPIASSAEYFILEADRLNLDWKLVAAISGVESYFGHHIPQNSYNAWGWAIFTGRPDGRYFEGWKDGITIVSEGIKEHYVNRGLDTVEKMGPIYAADRNWAWKVNHFMEDIESFQPSNADQFDVLL